MPIKRTKQEGKGWYEFRANDGAMTSWGTGIWYNVDDVINVSPAMNGRCYSSGGVVLPPQLRQALIALRQELLRKPTIDIGWYAKHTSLEFVYAEEIWKITPWTLQFDSIDFWPDGEYHLGNNEAYFEIMEPEMRQFLNERLGIMLFRGEGQLD